MSESKGGLSVEGFAKEQADLDRQDRALAGQERKGKLKLYFEFKTEEQRNDAKQLLMGSFDRFQKKMNEGLVNKDPENEAFRYLTDCKADPNRSDVGLEIDFSNNPPHLREIFEKLFADNGLTPQEKYKTVDDEPQPEETELRRAA